MAGKRASYLPFLSQDRSVVRHTASEISQEER